MEYRQASPMVKQQQRTGAFLAKGEAFTSQYALVMYSCQKCEQSSFVIEQAGENWKPGSCPLCGSPGSLEWERAYRSDVRGNVLD